MVCLVFLLPTEDRVILRSGDLLFDLLCLVWLLHLQSFVDQCFCKDRLEFMTWTKVHLKLFVQILDLNTWVLNISLNLL